MTALKEYARLETTGIWREGGESQRRDVVVSFGNNSLVVADRADRPLTHWSLAAVVRVNPGEIPAIFAPDPEHSETLEIEDPTMVAAIEKVRTLIARRRPQPGRLRTGLLLTLLAGVAAVLVFVMPEALVRHTVSVVPPATRAALGLALQEEVARLVGAPCRGQDGMAALSRLSERLLGPGNRRISVMPGGPRDALHLPGGQILIHRRLLEDMPGPETAAGFILAEVESRVRTDPIERFLREAGTATTFRLLTTGAVPAEAVANHAEALVLAQPDMPDAAALAARFAQAGVPTMPYARALDPSGETTLALIEADALRGQVPPAILSDRAWIALQGICTD
jgi:hypothetical protein